MMLCDPTTKGCEAARLPTPSIRRRIYVCETRGRVSAREKSREIGSAMADLKRLQ